MTDTTKDVDFHKRGRRVTRASLTKLGRKLTELEADTSGPDALRLAQNLASKLKTLHVKFKTYQLAIIDLTEGDADDADDASLNTELEKLDNHDDWVRELSVPIQRLTSSLSLTDTDSFRKTTIRHLKLQHMAWLGNDYIICI